MWSGKLSVRTHKRNGAKSIETSHSADCWKIKGGGTEKQREETSEMRHWANHAGVGEETERHFELNVVKRISDNPWGMKLRYNSPFSSYSKRKSTLLTGAKGCQSTPNLWGRQKMRLCRPSTKWSYKLKLIYVWLKGKQDGLPTSAFKSTF